MRSDLEMWRKYGNGLKYTFDTLPVPSQNAVLAYWGGTPTVMFGLLHIPVHEAKRLIIQHKEINFDNFDDYHEWYLSLGLDVDRYNETWPVIMEPNNSDGLFEDGWHRFHTYVERGEEVIPALVFFEAGQ